MGECRQRGTHTQKIEIMNVYLVFAPNGDIYHRHEEFLMDDLHDHMESGEVTLKAWRNDEHLDDHRAPMFTLTGNKEVQEWLDQRS